MKTLLTGIKPTGCPHLGNYIGAIQPALSQIKQLQNTNYLFIADYHSLTSLKDPSLLSHITYQVAASWLACGVDPKKTIIYRQSDIPELFELYWILSCWTPKGLLNRAHSYKAYIQANSHRKKEEVDQGINMGLFNYPILMAADILLFQAELVPVGKDQTQHLEITRDIADKWNRHFKSSIMILPQAVHSTTTPCLPGLDGQKMSKSYNNHIPLFCSEKELKQKVMKIKTDSLPPSAPKDPNTSTVFQIFKAFANSEQTTAFQNKLQKGCGWGTAKLDLANLLEDQLKSKRQVYDSLMNDLSQVENILKEGAVQARTQAQKMLSKIRKTIGLS